MIDSQWVIAAYRLILGREPENAEVVRLAAEGNADLQSLRSSFLDSTEFQQHVAAMKMPDRFPMDQAPYAEVQVDTDPETLRGLLRHVGSTWSKLGEEEPYWSVITLDKFKRESFDQNSSAYWTSGQSDLSRFISWIDRHRIDLRSLPCVMEYGCGTGRTTLWLARQFPRVIACDISKAHLAIAREQLSKETNAVVDFIPITLDALERLPACDVLFSLIVLQHNPPPLIKYLLGRLLRALKPGGVAYFQIPTYRKGYTFNLHDYLTSISAGGEDDMEMHVLPQEDAFEVIYAENCRVLEVQPDNLANSLDNISNTFLVQKTKSI